MESLTSFTVNLSGKVRRVVQDGVSYLVAPALAGLLLLSLSALGDETRLATENRHLDRLSHSLALSRFTARSEVMPEPSGRTGVYCILNVIDGKRYVGSSSVSLAGRIRSHREALRKGGHYNRYLQRAWNKYGAKAFRFLVLESCWPTYCIAQEQYWIDYFQSADPEFGYNLSPTAGSMLGFHHSKDSRIYSQEYHQLKSEIQKGIWADPEYREKIEE